MSAAVWSRSKATRTRLVLVGVAVLGMLGLRSDAADTPVPVLNLDQGRIHGRIGLDRLGDLYFSFQGIPYAQPPIDDLRFKAPKPAGKWNGTLMATKEGARCTQITYTSQFFGEEDCLFLNVYTPKINPTGAKTGLRNVFVWIHGGTYIEGSGNTDVHGPKNLMVEDIVLVTFNYRLSALGFMSFEDPKLDIPGNAAMRDQVLALKWVQTNIHHFGGDPRKVTVGGNSAGAASADFLVLSPLAKGLFNSVTVQSGCATAYWAMGERNGLRLAQVLGDSNKNYTEIEALELFRTKTAQQIVAAQLQVANPNSDEGAGSIGPVVESHLVKDPFLSALPVDIINTGDFNHVPYLIGFTDSEAIYLAASYRTDPSRLPQTIEDFEKIRPKDMDVVPGSDLSKKLAAKVQQHYFRHESASLQNLDKMFQLHTDMNFIVGINKEVLLLAAKNTQPVYYYEFTLDTEMNLYKQQNNLSDVQGAAHTDEKGYLFSFQGAPKIQPGSANERNVHRMTKLWSNFFRYGNPNGASNNNNNNNTNGTELIDVEWLPVTSDTLNYLEIGDTLKPGVNPESEAVAFWMELYAEAEQARVEREREATRDSNSAATIPAQLNSISVILISILGLVVSRNHFQARLISL